MDRRRFLIAAAAAASAVPSVLRAAPRSGGEGPRRTLRKAVMYGMIGAGTTVAEKFQVLRDCGFQGVEMDSPGSIPIEEIRAASDQAGIVVHGLVDSAHWRFQLNNPVEEVRQKGIDAMRQCLADAKSLGCVSILLVPAVVNAEMPYQEAYRLSQEAIRGVIPLAAEAGVRIGIENVWNSFLLSPMEAARYVDELQSPWVGWHFDIGNVINFGWPEQWVRTLGKRIVKLHIKDFSRKKRDELGLWKGFDVELGDGDAGWPALMAALDEVGYSTADDGRWATAEVRGGDETRLKQVSEQMDRLFAL